MNSAALQQAVYDRLDGFAALTTLLGTAGIRTRVTLSLRSQKIPRLFHM